jgi:putative proteasome-type protease
MTYCVAVLVDKGLVFASDSRTNAGVDQLSTYSKLFTFCKPGECALVILTAGNLATTQSVISQIRRHIKEDASENLFQFSSMNDVADYIGDLSIKFQKKAASPISSGSLDATASFIVGGQFKGERPKICMVYPEGNYISATKQTPYLQIGEIKYGKPILDRIIRTEISLEQAALCTLVSIDSTMQSNATVGPPIEALIYEIDSFSTDRRFMFSENDPYLLELKAAWDKELKDAFHQLTQFSWQAASERELDKNDV